MSRPITVTNPLLERGQLPGRAGRAAHWLAYFGTDPRPMAAAEGTEVLTVGGGSSAGRPALVVSTPSALPGPAIAHSEHVAVVFDGELHSRIELARSLGGPSEPVDEPAALVLRAFNRWGRKLSQRLHGDYAVIVWDRRHDELLCIRDRIGCFPFFYCALGDSFWASRSIPALADEPAIPAAVDPCALASHLRHTWPGHDETYLRPVRRLQPAHVLRWTDNRPSVERYWDPIPRTSATSLERDSGSFDPLFDRAVERRWHPHKTGLFLSGGLDSVAIAAVARELARDRGGGPLALCLLFPGEDASEEPVQRGVAEQLGLESGMLRFDQALGDENLVAAGLEWSSRLSAPLCNHWWPAYSQLAVMGRELGCENILTGTGGDEWLGVAPDYAADLMRRGQLGRLARLIAASVKSYRASPRRMIPRMLWRYGGRLLLVRTLLRSMTRMTSTPGLRTAGRGLIDLYRQRGHRLAKRNQPDWLAPDPALEKQLSERTEGRIMATFQQPDEFYLAEMERGLDHFLVSWQHEERFEIQTQLGVRFQHPFLDAELIEGLCRLAPEALNEGGRNKAPVRKSLERRFPHLGFGLQRKLLATDFWQTRVLATIDESWRELGGPTTLAELGIVDLEATERFREQVIRERRRTQVYRVWDLLNLETWARAQV